MVEYFQTVWQTIISSAILEVVRRAASVIPVIVGVLIILLFGWLVAKFLEQLTVRLLKIVKLDEWPGIPAVESFFAKGGVKLTLTELIGVLVYWLVMLIVFVMAMNALGLTVAAQLLDNAISYIPNVVVALFVLILGIFSATIVGAVIRSAAANAGLSMANGLGRLSQIVIVVFAAVAALNQLQIAAGILNTIITLLLASLSLGLGLAIGLGCKDIAGKYMNELLQQLQKKG
ncbi:MAG: hypothetical protein ABIH01_00970 [Candidatus Omnitrophota bacterium]